MIGSYSIFIYDNVGNRLTSLNGWKSFEVVQRLDAPDTHIIRMDTPSGTTTVSSFLRDTLSVGVDYQIKINRTDPISNETSIIYAGFSKTVVDQSLARGQQSFTLYGQGPTSLLKRRVVIPAVDEENSEKTGAGETIMKAYITDQMISPTDTDRIVPGLSVETDTGAGDTAAYSARYTNLATVIRRISEQANLRYKIVNPDKDTLDEFEFQVRRIWGKDKRRTNTDGNTPVKFDIFFGNMFIPILSTNASDEVTVVYVGGEGRGVDRTIIEVENTDRSGLSQWNRREGFADARRETDNDGLLTIGTDFLAERAFSETLTFNLLQTESSRWLAHYELGDIVDASYYGRSFEKVISQLRIVVTAGGNNEVKEIIDGELDDFTD